MPRKVPVERIEEGDLISAYLDGQEFPAVVDAIGRTAAGKWKTWTSHGEMEEVAAGKNVTLLRKGAGSRGVEARGRRRVRRSQSPGRSARRRG